jgi:hypothetical protein
VETLRVVLFVMLAALAVVGGWLVYTTSIGSPGIPGVSSGSVVWDVSASNPMLIGSEADRFAYAGGAAVQTASGTARVLLTASGTGSIEITLHARAGAFVPVAAPEAQDLRLTAKLDGTPWQDVDVNGNTGNGDARLPTTHATLGGTAQFDTGGGGAPLPGIWILADAVRRADGSIRQNGLVFSPLLRDKKGFSDPSRTEWTVLLYGQTSDTEIPVLLQIVFRDVAFARTPGGVTPP